MALVSNTTSLRGYHRRSGFSGKVFTDGVQIGELVAIEWSVESEQIPVPISGSYQDETKPGRETRRGSFRFQDVHDRWALMVWEFNDARRRGDRSAAKFPEFDIVTTLDDIGAPQATSWALMGCQLFMFDGGFAQEDQLLQRDVPFTFRSEKPLSAFIYGPDGVAVPYVVK